MKVPRSLRVRLALGLAAGLTAVWLLTAVSASRIVRHELDAVFDSAIQQTAQRLLPLAVMDILDRSTAGGSQRIAALRTHEELLVYVVRDEDGETVLRSHDADPALFPQQAPLGFSSTATDRIYAEQAVRGTITLLIAEPLAARRHAALEVSLAIAAPLLLLVPLSIVGGWFLVRAGLRPVERFCATIEARGGGDLTPLVGTGLPSEIEPIADAVNHLMARLRRTLDAERSFTANSAHELRTPIAAALAQTQRIGREAPSGPLRERARQVEASLHVLARITEKLMQLAKAEGGRVMAATAQDAVPVLSLIAEDCRRGPAGQDRLVLALPDAAVLSRIDPDALSILARNLIENALKHGDPQQPVAVALTADGIFSVVNAGPIVPPDALARLTERFERGATIAGGSGLGLAIAEAIAAAAGTRLELISPATGRSDGFEARIALSPRHAATA